VKKKLIWSVALAIAVVSIACAAHAIPVDVGMLGMAVLHQFPITALAAMPALGSLRTKDRGDGDDSLGEISRKLVTVVDNVKEFGESIRQENTELKARLSELEQKAARSPGGGGTGSATSVGELIVKSDQIGLIRDERQRSAKVFVKQSAKAALVGINGFVTGSGNGTYPAAPEHLGLVPTALPQVRLIDALPSRPVSTDSVDYVKLNGTGGADYQEGQGVEKAEKTFAGVLTSAKVQTIAVHTTVSKQLLDDEPALQDEIDRIFQNDLRQKTQRELLIGDGAQFHIPGLIGQATAVTGVTGDPADRIGLVAAQMDDAGYTPSLIVLNRTDWFGIQITKDDNGNYMFGSPTAGVPAALWGIRIVVAPNVPSDTALLIDTSKVKVLDREQPSLYITRDHMDYATKNLVLLLAEIRVGLAVYDALGVRKFAIAE